MPNSMLLIFMFVVIFILTIKLSLRKSPSELATQTKKDGERNVTSQRYYLETLRREIANIILSENLEVFEKAFYTMCDFENEIERSDEERRTAEQTILLKKFPNLEDFDIIGMRHFVRYYDGKISAHDIEGLVERYKDISAFMIVNRMFAFRLKGQKLYDNREIEVFRNCIRSDKNHRLRLSIEEGMRRYDMRSSDASRDYEDREFSIRTIPSFADSRYGVYCKKLNEFGIHSFFLSDDGKAYYNYYRSNGDFSLDGDSLG